MWPVCPHEHGSHTPVLPRVWLSLVGRLRGLLVSSVALFLVLTFFVLSMVEASLCGSESCIHEVHVGDN